MPAAPFRLATRGSPLARRQTALVADLLQAAWPGLAVETVIVRTEGDRRSEVALDRIGGQGIFTKEVQAAVVDGRADVAVHSAKDLPSTTPEGLTLAAVPERADPRDALVGRSLAQLPPGGVVATGSARRRAQLANLRPDLTFVDLRGNMAGRMDRAGDGSVDTVVVAAAALERLGWTDRITELLPVTTLLPQVGQGALALECLADDRETLAVLSAIDHRLAHRTLLAERAMLAAVGGSCALPVAAWAEPVEGSAGEEEGKEGALRLHGMLASGDGRIMVWADRSGPEPVALGRELARHLLEDCGGSSIEGWDPDSGPGPGPGATAAVEGSGAA